MAAGRNLPEATWGLEVVRGPAALGRARLRDRGQGRL